MSSWLCSPEHIGVLVCYLANDPHHKGVDRDATAETLARQNLQSVGYRYEKSDDQTAQESDYTDAADFVTQCKAWAWRIIPEDLRIGGLLAGAPDPVKLIKLARCYAYQACDRPTWDGSPAEKIYELVQAAAIGALPGYDAAPWSYEVPTPPSRKLQVVK